MADDGIASFLWASPQQPAPPSPVRQPPSQRRSSSEPAAAAAAAATPPRMQRVTAGSTPGGSGTLSRVETVETALPAEVVSHLVGGLTAQLKGLEEQRAQEESRQIEVMRGFVRRERGGWKMSFCWHV